MARPTKEESLLRKLDAQQTKVDTKAVDSYVDMYEIIEAVARNSKAADATRITAAKYVIERAEKVLSDKEQDEKFKEKEKSKEDFEFTSNALITTKYEASETVN